MDYGISIAYASFFCITRPKHYMLVIVIQNIYGKFDTRNNTPETMAAFREKCKRQFFNNETVHRLKTIASKVSPYGLAQRAVEILRSERDLSQSSAVLSG